MSVITCAWCDQDAVTEVEVEPAHVATVQRNVGRSRAIGLSRRMPACGEHAEPVGRPDPPPRKRGPIEGQMDTYDALGDEAT